jgi:hypothetical protein
MSGSSGFPSRERIEVMMSAPSKVMAVAGLVFVLTACGQETGQTEVQQPAPPPLANVEPAAPPPAPVPPPPSTELPVATVDSVMLSRGDDAPDTMIIRVLGTAVSGGWSLPKLEPMTDDASEASVLSYQFVATSPEAGDDTSTAAEQIEAELRLDSLPSDVTTIRIVSATNEVSAPVVQ